MLAALLCTLSACFFTTWSTAAKAVYVLYPSATAYSLLFFAAAGNFVILLPQAAIKHYRERHKHNLLLSWRSISLFQFSIAIGHILVVAILV